MMREGSLYSWRVTLERIGVALNWKRAGPYAGESKVLRNSRVDHVFLSIVQ